MNRADALARLKHAQENAIKKFKVNVSGTEYYVTTTYAEINRVILSHAPDSDWDVDVEDEHDLCWVDRVVR